MRRESGWAVPKPFLAVSILCLLLNAGCGTTPPLVPYPYGDPPPRTIAVLPLVNETVSMLAGRRFREVMHKNLRDKAYIPLDRDQIDQTLSNQLGISLGDQITEDLIPKIGKALGVDAVVSGVVNRFSPLAEVFNKWSGLEASFTIYESITGRKLWEYHIPGPWQSFFIQQLEEQEAEHRQLLHGSAQPDTPFAGTHPAFRELFCAIPTGAAPQRKVYKDYVCPGH
jgi:hypothetical protein